MLIEIRMATGRNRGGGGGGKGSNFKTRKKNIHIKNTTLNRDD